MVLIFQVALNSSEKMYDVMFFEVLTDFVCYLPIAQKLGIPVIGMVTMHGWTLADNAIGVRNNPAVIPVELGGMPPEMSFLERLENLWDNFVIDYYFYLKFPKTIEKLYHENLPMIYSIRSKYL